MNHYAPVGGALLVSRYIGDTPWFIVWVLAIGAAGAEYLRPKRRNKLQAGTGAILALACAVHGVGSRLALCAVLFVSVAAKPAPVGVSAILSFIALATLAFSGTWETEVKQKESLGWLIIALDFMVSGAHPVWATLATGVATLQPKANVYAFAGLVLPSMCGWNSQQVGRTLNDEGLYGLACIGALALCAAADAAFLELILGVHFAARWLSSVKMLIQKLRTNTKNVAKAHKTHVPPKGYI